MFVLEVHYFVLHTMCSAVIFREIYVHEYVHESVCACMYLYVRACARTVGLAFSDVFIFQVPVWTKDPTIVV